MSLIYQIENNGEADNYYLLVKMHFNSKKILFKKFIRIMNYYERYGHEKQLLPSPAAGQWSKAVCWLCWL